MHFLITAGPTREYLDPVRFITNASTGKMGYACVEAALKRNHKVTLISGPVALEKPKGAKLISVISSQDMARATFDEYPNCDCVIMTAAVSDYRPASCYDHKIKKTPGPMNVRFERTTDILDKLGQQKTNQILIGFAVQDKAPRKNAKDKLQRKNLDAIILNSPAAFASNRSDIQILVRGKSWQELNNKTKKSTGTTIIKLAESISKDLAR